MCVYDVGVRWDLCAATVCVQRSEDSSVGLFLSFYLDTDSKEQTLVTRLAQHAAGSSHL